MTPPTYFLDYILFVDYTNAPKIQNNWHKVTLIHNTTTTIHLWCMWIKSTGIWLPHYLENVSDYPKLANIWMQWFLAHGWTLHTVYKQMWVYRRILFAALTYIVYTKGKVLFFLECVHLEKLLSFMKWR